MKSAATLGLLVAQVAWLGGCATVDPRADFARAHRHIAGATDVESLYDPEGEAQVSEYVGCLLEDGLSADEAVQVSLLNHPVLQGLFFRIGVGRADVVQSGLLSNPSIGVAGRFPDGGGLLNIEASLAQNLVDLWQIPRRRRVAEQVLTQTVLEVAHTVARQALEAKQAYFRCVAAEGLVEIAQQSLAGARQLVTLTETLRDAGAVSSVDVNLSLAAMQEVEIELRRAELSAYEQRTELARLLGLTDEATSLSLTDPVPDPPFRHPTVDVLLGIARDHRLDVAAARAELSALADRLALERQSVFRVVEVGIEVEREARPRSSDGNFVGKTVRSSLQAGEFTVSPDFGDAADEALVVVGPSLSVELPLFDQNQAQIAKAIYTYQAAAKLVQALLLDITHDVRLAHHRAEVACEVAEYFRSQLVPLRERGLAMAREAYQAGKVSLLAVLESQRALQDARAEMLKAQRESAEAWIEIERVIARPASSWLAPPPAEQPESSE